jgi:hypothetical protein
VCASTHVYNRSPIQITNSSKPSLTRKFLAFYTFHSLHPYITFYPYPYHSTLPHTSQNATHYTLTNPHSSD